MRVVVTRAAHQVEPLASRLRAAGHDVVSVPLIAVEPVGPAAVDARGYDWLVVTSANAARELAARLVGRPSRIAAIGPGTATALAEAGLHVDLVARVSTQEGLLEALPSPAGRVLFAGAEAARTLLPRALHADVVVLYRTTALEPAVAVEGDAVVLASASAARAYGALGLSIPAVSIGPQTTAAARAAGVRVLAEAETHDVDGLVAAVGRVVPS